jgi:glutamyl-tRNA reductase
MSVSASVYHAISAMLRCGVMPILTYGINHKTAPIAIREKWRFNDVQATSMLQAIKHKSAMNEAVILSTCNRTEIYTLADHQPALQSWLQDWQPLGQAELAKHAYRHQGIDAVEHVMRVASGLDSMVLGEPQILGQMKRAYQLACQAGTVGKHLQQLFPRIFSASKAIRHETSISQSAVSIAYASVQIAQRIFSDLSHCRVLLVGSGEMMALVATHLEAQNVQQLTIASRHRESAQQLAAQYGAAAIRIGDIPQHLHSVDFMITATASQLPIIGKGMIESVLKQKKRRPMLMIDLAVPRDIEPEVSQLEDVYLYNLDDLQDMINANLKNRQRAAKQAEIMVGIHAEHYFKQLSVLNASDLITRYRQQVERLGEEVLQKGLADIAQGEDAAMVLPAVVRRLTNKILHQPTKELRQAAYENNMDLMLMMKKIYDL